MTTAAGPASGLLDPAALAAIADLQLVARTVVEGFLAGLHRDPRPGQGVEFAGYRSFTAGDDPRRVDWRAFARSDRLVVREAEVEREVTVRLLIDATASMRHPWHREEAGEGRSRARRRRRGAALEAPGAPGRDLTKLDHARVLVAALAYLADRQGDRLAFHAVRDGTTVDLAAGRRGQLGRLLHLLEGLDAAGRWPPWAEIARRVVATRSHEVVVVATDLHQGGAEIEELLAVFRGLGHEVLVFHLLGRDELELAFRGEVELVDLETGETVVADADALRPAYLAALEADLAARREAMARQGVRYRLTPLDEPLDRSLREMLLARALLP